MTTLEDKQRELDALQAAFDEYIASSRELEEELEADLTRCQEDLAKSESRASALSSQLADLRPQLASLETRASGLAEKLSSETSRRVAAETKTEEAEDKLRRSEGELAAVKSGEVRKLKEENEELCERLAFLEGEVECGRNELAEERERHREALEEVKGDLAVTKSKLEEKAASSNGRGRDDESAMEGSVPGEEADLPPPPPASPDVNDVARDDCVRRLEDDLRLTEEELSRTRTERDEARANVQTPLRAGGGGASSSPGPSDDMTDATSSLSGKLSLEKGTPPEGGSRRSPSKGSKTKRRRFALAKLLTPKLKRR